MPRRDENRTPYIGREHLTGAEVDRQINAARANRWAHRDATMILVAFRHGLRSSELVDLRWDQIDFSYAALHVRRAKKGTPATHPVVGDEMRALRKLHLEQDPKSPFVFTSERGSPFTTAGFARLVERAGVEAKLGFPAHPHMLRHACLRHNNGHDIRERCRLTSATATSSTRSVTPNCPPTASVDCGDRSLAVGPVPPADLFPGYPPIADRRRKLTGGHRRPSAKA